MVAFLFNTYFDLILYQFYQVFGTPPREGLDAASV